MLIEPTTEMVEAGCEAFQKIMYGVEPDERDAIACAIRAALALMPTNDE